MAIGFNPRLARIAQPLAQIAASIPATALLPSSFWCSSALGGGLGIASIVVLLLGTQWYVLFNVIAGAMAIPTDLKERCAVFRLKCESSAGKVILPGIFPYLITGMVTASGGAWNASIVAEYFHSKGPHLLPPPGSAPHLPGKRPTAATSISCSPPPSMMAATVVTVNRLLWRRLYTLAETRFRLET